MPERDYLTCSSRGQRAKKTSACYLLSCLCKI